jgi:hypothetical protein
LVDNVLTIDEDQDLEVRGLVGKYIFDIRRNVPYCSITSCNVAFINSTRVHLLSFIIFSGSGSQCLARRGEAERERERERERDRERRKGEETAWE